ncbi:MAG: hypothetical protein AMXMBFR84_18680 [Candidatus Hydrogenedentota bacterium]
MASQPTQNFATHVRRDNGIIGLALLAAIAVVLAIAGMFMGQELVAVAVAMLGVCVLGGFLKMRRYSLVVQDRVIRLEMGLRLAEVLPADLAARAKGLSLRQLIALRFASDAELPELVRTVFDQNIQDGKTIKQKVKDWQADHMRV